MSDIRLNHAIATPRCPLCGAETVLKPVHKAEAAKTFVFRCRACQVEYPVVKNARKDTKAS